MVATRLTVMQCYCYANPRATLHNKLRSLREQLFIRYDPSPEVLTACDIELDYNRIQRKKGKHLFIILRVF